MSEHNYVISLSDKEVVALRWLLSRDKKCSKVIRKALNKAGFTEPGRFSGMSEVKPCLIALHKKLLATKVEGDVVDV